MKKISIILFLALSSSIFAQQQPLSYSFNFRDLFVIRDFKVSGAAENQKNIQIAALDSNKNIYEKIEGPYSFVINGYIEKINFKKGIAQFNLEKLDASMLLIIHTYKENKVSKLIILRKTDNGIKAMNFPIYMVLVIFIGIIIFAAIIRKMAVYVLVALFIFYFFYKGVDLSTFIEILKTGVKNLIGN